MNTNRKPRVLAQNSQRYFTRLQGYVSQRMGKVQAIILNRGVSDPDEGSDIKNAVQEAIDEAFGKNSR